MEPPLHRSHKSTAFTCMKKKESKKRKKETENDTDPLQHLETLEHYNRPPSMYCVDYKETILTS